MEKQLEHQKNAYNDLSQKLECSEQEKLSLKELVKAEAQKEKEPSSVISKAFRYYCGKGRRDRLLNSLLSEGRVAELKSKVNELTEQLSLSR